MRIENAAIQLAYLKSTGMNRAEKERQNKLFNTICVKYWKKHSYCVDFF